MESKATLSYREISIYINTTNQQQQKQVVDYPINSSHPNAMGPPQLPTELIVTIAEFLAGSFAYGSLAKLNLATRAVHEETLPVLFDTVVWETNRRWWIHEGGHVPRGLRYTR